jgi:thiosulfate/3-mercaptopyruvate sulfurtransferase
MNGKRVWLHSVLMTTLLVTLLAGCGGGSVDEAPPPAAQTGDTSLFANASLLSTATTLDTAGVIVLDARHAIEDYNAGHIPGAIHAPPNSFTVAGQENVLLPAAELKTLLGAMGITKTSKIVIYDDTITSLGAGGRLFWMLEYLGCTNVSILNGGWDQWVAQCRPVETVGTVHPPIIPVAFEAFDTGVNAAISVDKTQVKSIIDIADGSVLIVDARTAAEYEGPDVETARPGHIPGAVNLPYTACYNADKTILNHNALKLLFESRGMTPKDKNIIIYSSVGKRSAFIYYLARLMGYTQVANYCGSAKEWASSDATDYPMVEGPTP